MKGIRSTRAERENDSKEERIGAWMMITYRGYLVSVIISHVPVHPAFSRGSTTLISPAIAEIHHPLEQTGVRAPVPPMERVYRVVLTLFYLNGIRVPTSSAAGITLEQVNE